MNNIDPEFINALVEDVYNRNQSLKETIEQLSPNETEAFQDAYDAYVVNGSHNAP